MICLHVCRTAASTLYLSRFHSKLLVIEGDLTTKFENARRFTFVRGIQCCAPVARTGARNNVLQELVQEIMSYCSVRVRGSRTSKYCFPICPVQTESYPVTQGCRGLTPTRSPLTRPFPSFFLRCAQVFGCLLDRMPLLSLQPPSIMSIPPETKPPPGAVLYLFQCGRSTIKLHLHSQVLIGSDKVTQPLRRAFHDAIAYRSKERDRLITHRLDGAGD